MNTIQMILILAVIVVTILVEYFILTGDYTRVPEVIKNVIVPKGKMCTLKGTFVDYMGRPLRSNTINCNTCMNYMSKDAKNGSCRQMQFDGAACSEYGDARKCPTS